MASQRRAVWRAPAAVAPRNHPQAHTHPHTHPLTWSLVKAGHAPPTCINSSTCLGCARSTPPPASTARTKSSSTAPCQCTRLAHMAAAPLFFASACTPGDTAPLGAGAGWGRGALPRCVPPPPSALVGFAALVRGKRGSGWRGSQSRRSARPVGGYLGVACSVDLCTSPLVDRYSLLRVCAGGSQQREGGGAGG